MGQFNRQTTITAVPGERVKVFHLSSSTVLPATQGEVIFAYPPAGTLEMIKDVRILIDNPSLYGAGSGDQTLIFYLSNTIDIDLSVAKSNYMNRIDYRYGQYTSSLVSQFPTDLTSQRFAFRDVIFDLATPLVVSYTNGSNVVSGGTRTINVLCLEKVVG